MLIYIIFLAFAALGGVIIAIIYQPGSYQRRGNDTYPIPSVSMVGVPLSRVKPYPPPSIKRKLLSPHLDDCLQEVIDLTLKHHVIPTYKLVGQDDEAFFKSVLPKIWGVLLTLFQRMGKVDTMKLVSQDLVQLLRSHFENFHGIHYSNKLPENKFPKLEQFPYLESPEHELNFLRQVCEVLLCVCLPKDLLDCTPVRVLVREYLTCRILQPTIDMICDPDYINQKMVAYLLKKEETLEQGKLHSYKYKDFEDFMNHIKKSEDVTELQNIRQSIITDLILAKAVYKMKHSHTTGLQGKQFPIPIPAEKLKVLMGRDLELYIRQLGTAKTSCDRQLRKQGGEDYVTPVIGTYSEESQRADKPLGIPFETIMRNEVTRMYLLRFMEDCGYSHLLGFWIAADSLRNGTEVSGVRKIYDLYLNPLSHEAMHVDVDLVKPIHNFVSGVQTQNSDACLHSVAIIQKLIYEEIHDQFYNDFIWSEHYRELMYHNQSSVEGVFSPFDGVSTASSYIDDESNHRKKLKSLKMKLENKDSQLSQMPDQGQACRSLEQRKRALKKDTSHLKEEIKKLEHYIDHTEEWFDTVGQWSVEVHSVDLSKEENNDRNPLFIIVVHRQQMMGGNRLDGSDHGHIPPPPLPAVNDSNPTLSQDWKRHQQQHQRQFQLDGATSSTVDSDETWSDISESESDYSGLQTRSGWVLGRHLSEFEKLHEKVIEICPNLQLPPLPKRLNIFQRYDSSSYWQKYQKALERYLCQILQDERLKECEEVFNFVSHASDSIKAKSASQPEKKNRFSLSNVPVIQSIPGIQMFGIGKDALHEENPKELDATSEYMYLLVSEIFELDHFSKVLRRQLVELVQLTYGKDIDRELQDTMNWVFSEPMLIFYLNTLKDAMWPNGNPAPPGPTRSDEEKAITKEEARGKLLKNAPQALQTILGQRNCQIGIRKIFELLQDSRGNKQLFYALLEVLVYAFVPELEQVELDGDDTTSDWKEN